MDHEEKSWKPKGWGSKETFVQACRVLACSSFWKPSLKNMNTSEMWVTGSFVWWCSGVPFLMLPFNKTQWPNTVWFSHSGPGTGKGHQWENHWNPHKARSWVPTVAPTFLGFWQRCQDDMQCWPWGDRLGTLYYHCTLPVNPKLFQNKKLIKKKTD